MRRSIGLFVFLTRAREYFALGATAALEIRGVLPRREVRFGSGQKSATAENKSQEAGSRGRK